MPPFDRTTSEQIKIGMSEDEVESILGPPGDYASRPLCWEGDFQVAMHSWWHVKEWVGDDGMIQVRFGDSTRKVLSIEFREAPLPTMSLVDRLRGWFRRRAISDKQ